MKGKVFVLGLDGIPPSLFFEDLKEEMPNIKKFLETASYGSLESTHPPITCPAWMTMMTGKDPGQLGLYGFRNRKGFGYEPLGFASSRDVRFPTVWESLSFKGKEVIVLGVPPSYPPRPVNGYLVTCLFTPDLQSRCTYPHDFKEELLKVAPRYAFDVENFRSGEKEKILDQIYEMTLMRSAIVQHLLKTKSWDFFMVHEIATDRLHHAFWKYYDRLHPRHDPENPFRTVIRGYYRMLDAEIGKILDLLDDTTDVFIVSDHGSKALHGGIAVNEYLVREGYLVLKNYPRGSFALTMDNIDWRHTRAWGEGGYYARFFLNVKDREPSGIIPASKYHDVRLELKEKFEKIPDENGNLLDTRVFFPEDLYREVNGPAPDLMVYFDNLNRRSIGTLGYPSIYASENDTGPDHSNHSFEGIFAHRGKSTHRKKLEGMHISQIAGEILNFYKK